MSVCVCVWCYLLQVYLLPLSLQCVKLPSELQQLLHLPFPQLDRLLLNLLVQLCQLTLHQLWGLAKYTHTHTHIHTHPNIHSEVSFSKLPGTINASKKGTDLCGIFGADADLNIREQIYKLILQI